MRRCAVFGVATAQVWQTSHLDSQSIAGALEFSVFH